MRSVLKIIYKIITALGYNILLEDDKNLSYLFGYQENFPKDISEHENDPKEWDLLLGSFEVVKSNETSWHNPWAFFTIECKLESIPAYRSFRRKQYKSVWKISYWQL